MADPTLHVLLETTYTKENFHRKIMLLKEFFSKRFFKDAEGKSLKEDLEDFLIKNNVGDSLRNSILSLPNSFFDYFNGDNYAVTLDSLESEVENLPKLILYVATVLPPAEVAKLGIWIRENIKQGVFIDLHVEASVVGGCSFVWNGVHHDYSMSYYFDKHKNEIRNLVRSLENE
jgi:hypothetical protein